MALKNLLTGLALAAVALPTLAADAAAAGQEAPKTQPARMASCSAQAKDKALKGDERKAFMKECQAANKASQQAKREDAAKKKGCSADAKSQGLKGDARKAFIKDCVAAGKAATS